VHAKTICVSWCRCIDVPASVCVTVVGKVYLNIICRCCTSTMRRRVLPPTGIGLHVVIIHEAPGRSLFPRTWNRLHEYSLHGDHRRRKVIKSGRARTDRGLWPCHGGGFGGRSPEKQSTYFCENMLFCYGFKNDSDIYLHSVPTRVQ